MRSAPGVRSDLFSRQLDKTLITDFFGGVSQAEVVAEEAIESHTRSTFAERDQHPSVDDNKTGAVKPSAKKGPLKEPSSVGYGIPSATIRAWAGASIIGLFIAGIVVNAS